MWALTSSLTEQKRRVRFRGIEFIAKQSCWNNLTYLVLSQGWHMVLLNCLFKLLYIKRSMLCFPWQRTHCLSAHHRTNLQLTWNMVGNNTGHRGTVHKVHICDYSGFPYWCNWESIHPSIIYTTCPLTLTEKLEPIPVEFKWEVRYSLGRTPIYNQWLYIKKLCSANTVQFTQ